jgi:DMSO/TMAO reductase YedYZ molybdopterin-dependent catalytic subunit
MRSKQETRMLETRSVDRRKFLAGAAGAAALLGGCDRLAQSDTTKNVLASAETLTSGVQHLISPEQVLAPEYTEADLSRYFKPNGTADPDNDDYQEMAAKGFANWTLEVEGLVERPAKFALAELRALPSRTQITRHDCVEGWSCIGKWKGAVLGALLQRVGLQASARFLMFYCADPMDIGDSESKYYESIDIAEAMHSQTILAYDMNDKMLDIPHGAPLRLRVERQLGYKMAKYLMRIEAVESFKDIRGGKGGYWEDLGYAWYAGI